MSFVPPYRYVTASALASALKNGAASSSSAAVTPTKRRDIAIIDVRDDDFEGGNIVGALNVPSTTFDQKVHQLVEKELKDVPTVIFHCSLSQQRGPKSARIYSETRRAALDAGVIKPLSPATTTGEDEGQGGRALLQPEDEETGGPRPTARRSENGGQTILVLRDGFSNFGRVYKEDKALVEGWDEEAWSWR